MRLLLRVAMLVSVLVASLAIGATAGASGHLGLSPADHRLANTTLVAVPNGVVYTQSALPKSAEVVYYGIEPMQAYDFSLSNDTWDLTFNLWFRWKAPHGAKGVGLDPSTSTEFDNTASAPNNYSVQYSCTNSSGGEQPCRLSDGYYYQDLYIQAGFADNFDVSRYPLDTQRLQIRFENSSYDEDQMVYVPDPSSPTTPTFHVPNWSVSKVAEVAYVHHYDTDFGDSNQAGAGQNWSLGTYTVTVHRPYQHFIFKLFLPLIVVFCAALFTLFLKGEHEGSRLALSATGLLTLIFLQQGYSSDLPSPSPLVLMDSIYMLAMTLILIILGRVVWETTQIFHHKVPSDAFLQTDRRIASVIFSVFIIGSLGLVLLG